MSNMPLVSAIITTKNEEAHIENCLKSIAAQSYKNIEIIVVDNNSTDRTKKIAEKFTKNIFNAGPERSAQRNFGAKKAKGEYLIFIDADMILTKNVISDCIGKLSDKEVGAVVVPERSIGKGYWAKVKAFERSLYEGDSSIEAARFFKTSIFLEVGGYNRNITGPEDWDLPQRVKRKYKVARAKNFILHDEGNVSLLTLMRKKYYYGLKVPTYLNNDHPLMLTVQQVVYLLRPAFYRNWKKLTRNPRVTLGMIIMLSLEQMAGFMGFVRGLSRKK